MPRRENAPSSRRLADQLVLLRKDPERAAALALEIVEAETNPEILRFALDSLAAHPVPGARESLLACYGRLDSPKRDAGGFTRAALLSALRKIAVPGDAALFERAATTYEPSLADGSAPAVLRARGLVALNDVDDARASFVAARLLADTGGVSDNGEPAATAARVLAMNGESLLLYHVALMAEVPLPGEVRAECLRGLTPVPGDLLAPVLADVAETQDELVLLALCDLLVGHAEDASVTVALERLLAGCASVDVYRYLTAAIAASRAAHLVAALVRASEHDFDAEKLEALAEVLPLVAAFPGARAAGELVAQRQAGRAAAGGEKRPTP